MWVNYNGFAINTSMCTCIICDDDNGTIAFYYRKSEPDLFEFKSNEQTENAFQQIMDGIKDGLKYLEI